MFFLVEIRRIVETPALRRPGTDVNIPRNDSLVQGMLEQAQKVYRGESTLSEVVIFYRKTHPQVPASELITFVSSFGELRLGKRLYSRLHPQHLRAMLDAIAEEGPHELCRALQALEAGFTPIGKRKKPEPPMGSHRLVLREYQERLASMATFAVPAASFDAAVEQAAADLPAARAARLALAARKPRRVVRLVQDFERNPDVVAEVLFRAQGCCEGCSSPAPFMRRSDGSPYLEVHHVVRLVDGGDDTVENALALCPNCHRRQHFGAEGDEAAPPGE